MESDLLKQHLTQAVFDPTVTPDPYESLDHILDVAEEENLLPMLVNETVTAPKDTTVVPARFYIQAFALFRLGKPESAWPAALRLAGKLEQEGRWPALALLCGRALDYQPNVDAALQIAKAFESAGFEDLDPALLHKAYGLFPDECRLAYLMGEDRARSAAKAGGAETPQGRAFLAEAYEYWAESLDGFVALKRHAAIEEALLKIAESDNPMVLRHVVAALKRLGDQALPKKPGEQSGWGRVEAMLELALPSLRRAKLVPEVWRNLLNLLSQMPPGNSIRRWLSDLAPEAFPEADGIHDLLNRSGILDPEVKVDAAMKSLDPMLALAPGYFILHASWGVGRIRLNDGETLILDFQGASNHRMSVALARRALTVVPADDLRVLKVENLAGLKSRVKDDPEGIVYLAIRQLGGTATTQELKRVLVAEELLSVSQWTGWWKTAKAAIEQDDRFDLSQAFRQTYRIRAASDSDEIALPVIVPRRGVRPNLNLIRRFLDQHPDETGRAARVYSAILARWAKQERTTAEEKMAISLQLYRWQRKVDDDFVEALGAVLEANHEASTFADLEDQTLMVKVGLEHDRLWRKTACLALSSRYLEVREQALVKLRSDVDAARGLLAELIEQPNDRPVAALSVITLATARETQREPFAPQVWDAAYCASMLAEGAIREPIRKQALAVLGPKTTLTEMLLKTAPAEVQVDRLSTLIRRWRTSERFLQPLDAIMRAAGFEQLVRDLRTERMARTNQMLQSHAEQDALILPGELMTRATFHKLQEEIQFLDTELHTTVSQAIARARALGDLSENAEFDAAKAKQRDYTARMAHMAKRIERSLVIEEYHPPDGRAAPGTEVHLEEPASGMARTYWILGEGDDYHGPDVLSYAAPLGRALLGRRVGDKVPVPTDGEIRDFVVKSVKSRLPAPVSPKNAGDISPTA